MYPVLLVLGLSLLYADISQGTKRPKEQLNRNRRQSSSQFIFPQQLQLGPIVPALKLPQQNFQTNKNFPFLLPPPLPPLPPLPPFLPPNNFQLFNPTNNPNSNNNRNPNIPPAFQKFDFQSPNTPQTIKPFFPFPSFLFPFPIKTVSTTTKTIVLTTPTSIHTTTTSPTNMKTTTLTSTTMTPSLSTLSSTTSTIVPSTKSSTKSLTTIATLSTTTTTPSTTIATKPTTTPLTTILTTYSAMPLTSPQTVVSTQPATTSLLTTTVLVTTLAPITTTCKPRPIQPTESPPTIQCTGDGCQYSLTFERNRKVIVDNHNKRRREITEASNMYEMIWDTEAANIAQKQADVCSKVKPSTAKYSKFECNFNTYASEVGIPWAKVIAKWSDEKTSFTYGVESAGTEHFIQIIWADSYLIGCGYTKCDKEYTYVCAYCPGRNNAGKRDEPYKKGVPCHDCPCGECHNSLCLPPD